eukprot:1158302-Pelagomonas_calceolata.AAC.7
MYACARACGCALVYNAISLHPAVPAALPTATFWTVVQATAVQPYSLHVQCCWLVWFLFPVSAQLAITAPAADSVSLPTKGADRRKGGSAFSNSPLPVPRLARCFCHALSSACCSRLGVEAVMPYVCGIHWCVNLGTQPCEQARAQHRAGKASMLHTWHVSLDTQARTAS